MTIEPSQRAVPNKLNLPENLPSKPNVEKFVSWAGWLKVSASLEEITSKIGNDTKVAREPLAGGDSSLKRIKNKPASAHAVNVSAQDFADLISSPQRSPKPAPQVQGSTLTGEQIHALAARLSDVHIPLHLALQHRTIKLEDSDSGVTAIFKNDQEPDKGYIKGVASQTSDGIWEINYMDGGIKAANGKTDFVVLNDGNNTVLVGKKHYALAKGQDILYGGEVTFKDGEVTSWNNGSGHYMPHPGFSQQAPFPQTLFAPAHTTILQDDLKTEDTAKGKGGGNFGMDQLKTELLSKFGQDNQGCGLNKKDYRDAVKFVRDLGANLGLQGKGGTVFGKAAAEAVLKENKFHLMR